MPMWNKMSFQNANSPVMEHMTFFHDHSMILILSILMITLNMITSMFKSTMFNLFSNESHETEMFWTSIPAMMLIFIASPSLKTLYLMEENMKTILSVKTMGLQWYWNYEYPTEMGSKKLSSNMVSSLKNRSLITNNALVIPSMTPTRMMISSKDVLHSWAIPSLGVKCDATPGRINQSIFIIKRPSILMGQCSEICGAGHSFMPIYMESPNIKSIFK